MDLIKIKEILETLIKIYLFVSPFIILYLYNKLKFSNNWQRNVDVSKELEKITNNPAIDFQAYLGLVAAYGSVREYEDARMKDFETMRGYLKTMITVLEGVNNNFTAMDDYVRENIKHNGDYLEVLNTLMDYFKSQKKDINRVIEHITEFVSSEEEAHSNAHDFEDIREERRKHNE